VAAAVPAVSYAIFGFTTDQSWLILASVIGGIGIGGGLASALQTPALISVLASGVAESRRATLIALVQASWVVAQGVGAVLSFLPAFLQSALAQTFFAAHSTSYFLMSALAIVSALPLFFLTGKTTTAEGAERAPPTDTGKTLEMTPAASRGVHTSKAVLLKFSIVFALGGFGVGMLVQLLPTWYNLKFGVSEGTAGLWMAIAQIPSLAAVPLIPQLVRRKGALFTSVTTGFIATFFVMFMPLAGQFEIVALLFVGRSIFWSITWPVLQSYVVGGVAEKERGAAVGVTYAAWSITNAAATFMGAYLFNIGQLQVPFVIATAAFFGTITTLLIFFRNSAPEQIVTTR
jgi:MFS family permease